MTKNRHVGTLQKWWEFCTLSKCAQKIFFGKILCSTHQKKCFYKLLGSFWKIEFLMENRQPRTLQKWWKFCTISNVLRIFFFWQNSLFHLSKEVFLQTFRQFLENWIFDGKSTAADLTKTVKTLYSLKICLENIFLAKIICSTHQKKLFYKILGSFWKIEFLMETRQTGPRENGENFVLSQNVLRKYFLAKFFVPLIKRSVSTNFKAVFGKLNFWRKIDSRGPYKNGENFVLSQNVLRKHSLAKFFIPPSKRSVSTNF